MDCARCKRSVIKPIICKTCKLSYHPSCAKEVVKTKLPKNCCVKSITTPLSPLSILPITSDQTSSRTSILRPSSFSSSKRLQSSQSSFKSANSSPKTPPATTIGDDSVFLSPSVINSPTMVGTNNPNTLVKSQIMSDSDSQTSAETTMSEIGIQISSSSLSSSQVTVKKPDWSKYTLEDKMNMLLDMSFKNSMNIQNVSDSLKKHSEQIQNLAFNINANNGQIKTISQDLKAVNETLTEVTKAQLDYQDEIKNLRENLNENTTKCEENSTAITIIKSTLDSLANTQAPQTQSQHRSSSQLLISGIPNTLSSEHTNEQIINKVFDKLNIGNLVNDILDIREFVNKRRQSGPNSSQNSRSIIIKLKSSEICEHIIEVKRRSPKLLVKSVFNTNSKSDENKLIYINEFLHTEAYKFLQKIKTKAKLLKIKYVWTFHGNVYAKKDDDSPKALITSEDDLTQLS